MRMTNWWVTLSTVADSTVMRRLLALDAACVLGWTAISLASPRALGAVTAAPYGIAFVAATSAGLAAVAVLGTHRLGSRRRLLRVGGAVNIVGCVALIAMAPAPHTAALILLVGGGLLTVAYLRALRRDGYSTRSPFSLMR